MTSGLQLGAFEESAIFCMTESHSYSWGDVVREKINQNPRSFAYP